jgi:hypothetical protein
MGFRRKLLICGDRVFEKEATFTLKKDDGGEP